MAFHGWVAEHRLVAATALGRRLTDDEDVHHINGVKTDNREDNLVVITATEHAVLTVREYRERMQAAMAELEEYRRRFGPLTTEGSV